MKGPFRNRRVGPLLVLGALLPRIAFAQLGDGGVCVREGERISELEHSLATTEAETRAAQARAFQLAGQLSVAEHKISECGRTIDSCQAAREGLCEGIGNVAQSILQATAMPGDVGGCLSTEQREQLGALTASWTRMNSELGALFDFEIGVRDVVPHNGIAKQADAERALARLVAGGHGQAPLIYRRLLVGALSRIAPGFWRKLRGGGASAIDAWFSSTEKLDADLVIEARTGADTALGPPGSAGPPLAAALKFVQTYSDLAGCTQLSPDARDCPRARQLQTLLESSGPLVTQRRQQAIWATDCRVVGAATVLEWLQDFPSPQPAIGETGWTELTATAYEKLYSCFLNDLGAGTSYASWVERRFPSPHAMSARELARVDGIRAHWREGADDDLCAQAVRSIQVLREPSACALPEATLRMLSSWLSRQDRFQPGAVPATLHVCAALLGALWQGKVAHVPAALAHPPAAEDLVAVDSTESPTPMARLRAHCESRHGTFEAFPIALRALAEVAERLGESPAAAPWHADPVTLVPLDQQRFGQARIFTAWLRHLSGGLSECDALGLDAERCERCVAVASESRRYDCALVARLERHWDRWRDFVAAGGIGALAGTLFLAWIIRFAIAWRRFGAWTRGIRSQLPSLALRARSDPFRLLFPSRLQFLTIDLPRDTAWERWGRRATIVRAAGRLQVLERDVNHAASVARSVGAEFSLLVHPEGAAPDLPAVRAMLEWAARGATRAVQIVPISDHRLRWARNSEDLLDLVEQTSLRGNPFELRGRITSGSQFFNRERLVSGLLAGVQAGRWLLVGGLRRFGKSSLALEVARRLPGPSAYVDLAGFYHEIAFHDDAASAADSILRYVSLRLYESARVRYRGASSLPDPLLENISLDSTTLAQWFGAFSSACAAAEGQRAASILIILDELEQAIGVGPERLVRALDVFSILMGRLRTALGGGGATAAGGTRTGVLLCGALHPLLWAPLPALAGQSLMGSFESVFVTCLSDEAASHMMRGLGARQGVRFTDAALRLIVREAQGVPLLVRRLGSSVLELYDPERARQGSLGAVEIGIEGAAAAVRREEDEGSPLRVWVESEIADAQSPAGMLLRTLAQQQTVRIDDLRRRAADRIARHFVEAGIDRLLDPGECERRALEAASVIVRMLGETGLLQPEGDLSQPDAYTFPDGMVRRILSRRRESSPFAL